MGRDIMLRPFAHRSGTRPDVAALRTSFWETVTQHNVADALLT